jgi:type VI secretion system protein ImpH
VLRFRTPLSLEFPASEIQSLDLKPASTRSEGDKASGPLIELCVAFMGLVGPSGVLPRHYTELLIEQHVLKRDRSAHDFLDLFSHRLIALFYRAWKKYRFHLHYEQAPRADYPPYLLEIAGLGPPGLRNRLRSATLGVGDQSLAFFAGLANQRPCSVAALAQILSDYFGVACKIIQFRGRWIELPDSEQTAPGRHNHRLGEPLSLGARVWDTQSRLKLEIGPLTRELFDQFIPGRAAFEALKHLLRFLTGLAFDYDVQLTLRKEAVHGARLHESAAPRLGWDGWLTTKAIERERADAIYTIVF